MITVSNCRSLVSLRWVALGLAVVMGRQGQAAMDGPPAGCDEIVFAQRVSGNDHWYGNFGHYCETESPYTDRAMIKEGDMRWEYVDRHMMRYHHLWTINPDGTAVMVFFGNQHPGGVMIDAKPIPGTDKVVASFSPGHGRTEHEGIITIVDPRRGPDDMSMARKISPRYFRDPYLADYEARLSDRERTTLRLWIESGAVYPGTYGALGSGVYTVEFPAATIERRCGSCHQATQPPYRNPKPGAVNFQFGHRQPPQPLLTDLYDIILIRHLAYFQLGEAPLHQGLCNLDRPEKSLLLRAPLGKQAGGLQRCGQPVFQDASDPDYREILATIQDAAAQLAEHKRFDMPGFRPNRFYIREMQHFGIVPQDLSDDAPVDTYAVERAYWDTFRCEVTVHGVTSGEK